MLLRALPNSSTTKIICTALAGMNLQTAASVMVELNGVHPFREGNGRTQRVFISELAKDAATIWIFPLLRASALYKPALRGTKAVRA